VVCRACLRGTPRSTRVRALSPALRSPIPATMNRVSSRGHVVRAAKEARIVPPDSAAKKSVEPTSRNRPKRVATPVRMKVVWEVCGGTGSTIKTFPYPDKAAAEAQTKALTRSTGRAHMLRATKVPME
jgi:hypothetical protein